MAFRRFFQRLLLGLSALAGVLAILDTVGMLSTPRETIVVEPQRVKVAAEPNQPKVEVRYSITNRTAQTISLGPTSTT